ncbi:MAG: hypothetical protein QM723_15115 [Myxococcaceae bacterium]
MTIQVSEDLLRAIATKDKALSDGRTLSKKGAFKNMKVTKDESLLWGQCQGSGAKPYELSIDLIGQNPTIRCTCPVKPPPCKHTLGFMVHYLEAKPKFAVAEPPPDLVEKRGKLQERAEKKAEDAAKPKEVNKEALAKKTKAQRDGLDLLEKLVADVAASGLGTITPKRADNLKKQSRQLRDAYLPGAAVALTRLAALADQGDRGDDADGYDLFEPGDDLPDEQRHKLMARHLTRLWAMVKRGKESLDEKLSEGESQDEADAVVEDLLGKVWQYAELKGKGRVKTQTTFLELAYERYDDESREERVEQGFLADLSDGTLYSTLKYRPNAALDRVTPQVSYEDVLEIAESVVYPGFTNRRIRWELASQRTRPATHDDWRKLHAIALPDLGVALTKFKEQIKNPLAPEEAVFLIRTQNIQRKDGEPVLVDEKGGRLLLRDSVIARAHTTSNLVMAAGASLDNGKLKQPASVLVRLWLGLDDNVVMGQPLALVIGNSHIRLGM